MIRKKNILASVVTRKSAKDFYKNFYTKRQPQKLPLLNFLLNFLTERKFQMKNFLFLRLKFI